MVEPKKMNGQYGGHPSSLVKYCQILVRWRNPVSSSVLSIYLRRRGYLYVRSNFLATWPHVATQGLPLPPCHLGPAGPLRYHHTQLNGTMSLIDVDMLASRA